MKADQLFGIFIVCIILWIIGIFYIKDKQLNQSQIDFGNPEKMDNPLSKVKMLHSFKE